MKPGQNLNDVTHWFHWENMSGGLNLALADIPELLWQNFTINEGSSS